MNLILHCSVAFLLIISCNSSNGSSITKTHSTKSVFLQFHDFLQTHPSLPGIITDLQNLQLRKNIMSSFKLYDRSDKRVAYQIDRSVSPEIISDEYVCEIIALFLKSIVEGERNSYGHAHLPLETMYIYFDLSVMFQHVKSCPNCFLNIATRTLYHTNGGINVDKIIEQIFDSTKQQFYNPYESDKERNDAIKVYKMLSIELIDVYEFEKKISTLHNDIKKLYASLDENDRNNIVQFIATKISTYLSSKVKNHTARGYFIFTGNNIGDILIRNLDAFYASEIKIQTINNFIKCWIFDELNFNL